ncbi:MAG: hypothetical protein HOY69_26835 [Streptomyces sp.]|nr:hypothetical protein [Streptomyces sp.]
MNLLRTHATACRTAALLVGALATSLVAGCGSGHRTARSTAKGFAVQAAAESVAQPTPPTLPPQATVIVGAAWLNGSQLPGADRFDWHPQGTATAIADVQQLHQDLWTPWCGGLNGFTGRQELTFSGAGGGKAQQFLFTFPSAQAASTAYQTIVNGRTHCQDMWRAGQSQRGIPADAVITRTADGDGQSAWSWRWTGFETVATTGGPQIDHEYLVQRGAVLTILDLDDHLAGSTSSPAFDTAGDAGVLHDLSAHLCSAYGCR